MQSVIASSSRDYTIRLWDARLGGEALSSLEGHMNEVTKVQWHANGHFLLSGAKDSQLKVSQHSSRATLPHTTIRHCNRLR